MGKLRMGHTHTVGHAPVMQGNMVKNANMSRLARLRSVSGIGKLSWDRLLSVIQTIPVLSVVDRQK
jgi:hypothetical protein